MKIKQAKKRDLEQLYELEKSTFPAAEAADRESVKRRLEAHSSTFWIVKVKGRIVSAINGITTNEENLCDEMFACEDYYDKKGSWLMIFGVSTLEEYQHKGYASKIMKGVLQDVKRCKLDGVVLTCKEGLLGFYEQFGFVDEGVCESTHGGAVWHQMRIRRDDIKRDYKGELIDMAVTVAAAAVIAFVLGHFVVLNCNVPTGSMLETIQLEDNIIGNRLTYKFSDPQRGDIAIFLYPDDESQVYIKRIIGLPGETIEIRNGRIYVNGSDTPLSEDYLRDGVWTDTGVGEDSRIFEIPEDCYLMLGDNREESWDARFWDNTYVKRSKILAKAEFIYFPFKDATWLGSGADY